MKTIDEMTAQELEQLAAKKKKEEQAKLNREKIKYEKNRDAELEEMIDEARDIFGRLQRFKKKVNYLMDQQQVKLEGYGKIRSNSKGGFSVMNTEGTMMVKRRLDSEPRWDERADKGAELVKEFLFDSVKKKDKDVFTMLMGFLTRNNKGDLEYSQVFRLLHHEALFQDERWIEGLRLLKEGYHLYYKGFGYEFKIKNNGNKWEHVSLNFSSI